MRRRYALLLCLLKAGTTTAETSDTIEQGRQLTFARNKGNCLACHVIENGDTPGNIGPPLFSMRQRFTDKNALRRQIWDATAANPDTSMPPFGRKGILTEEEIDKIVEYLWSI